ncbi:MAG: cob(I)yrinic acid a,c-diamide adenosyltransferase [Candidatus Gastranaerophilaceae bacterium]|jgi:cob(I)yrinic acid a,c-diamide adenosyltransferase|uniref:Cob(I)yrinic acid a,c-diamide adenosyltransferase n=1 Tax=Candidatus Limenecus avicola TaxID=2840847 RepID=A0A9D1N0X5_9CLOT|nr:cob(I)alamin adenosyltransferase [Clostridium sp. CAG:306]HIU93178.1 cob(I)yrinic acid a,c-diamide adenosyltransferase [Candidatus Limenecus avicola]
MAQTDDNKLYNPEFLQHGYIQVYTGNGKGKTTASLGLAMRALGRGWKVLIVMFTKGGNDYGELIFFSTLCPELKDKVKIVQAGLDRIVYSTNMSADDSKQIQKGWEIAKKAIQNDEYQLIILDEANIALDLNLIDLNEMIDVLKNKPEEMEIVLTGRNAKEEIIDIAHLVSEIKPVKHYWDKGIKARKGIEF